MFYLVTLLIIYTQLIILCLDCYKVLWLHKLLYSNVMQANGSYAIYVNGSLEIGGSGVSPLKVIEGGGVMFLGMWEYDCQWNYLNILIYNYYYFYYY